MLRLFLLFPLLPLIITAPATDYTNEADFKVKFNASLATLYSAAIEDDSFPQSLNNQSSDFDPENIRTLIKFIDDASLNESQRFIMKMKLAYTNAIQEVNQMDAQMTELESQISQTEDQITSLNSEIEKTQTQIRGTQNQVSLATQALNQAQQKLARHQRALQEAQKRLDKAEKRCQKGRKGGFLSQDERKENKGVNKTKKPVEKFGRRPKRGVCNVPDMFTRDIARIKHDISRAKSSVNKAQGHLNKVKKQLADQKTQLDCQQRNLQVLQVRLVNLQRQFNDPTTKRDQMNTVNQIMDCSVGGSGVCQVGRESWVKWVVLFAWVTSVLGQAV